MFPYVKDSMIATLFSVAPKRLSTSFIGSLAHSALSRPLLRYYVWSEGVDMSEAAVSDLGEYETLSDLFTRTLKPGARPIDGEALLVSPADAEVAFCGRAAAGSAAIMNGREIDLAELLAGVAPTGDDDECCVLYLSPRDYHRVHAPCDATLTKASHVAGELFPVKPSVVRAIDGVFQRNERVAMALETAAVPGLTLTMVAAFGVGHVMWPDGVVIDGPDAEATAPFADGALERGAELATFGLGSTVILTAPKGSLDWAVAVGDKVRVGRPLARAAGERAPAGLA